MEILKHLINWFTTTNLSNQAVVVIAMLVLAYLMVYGFMKIKKTSVPKIGASSIWKLFLSIISVTIIFLICYGFYLLAVYCWPTPEQLAFKELSKNLAENELWTEKDTLKALNEKVKDGKTLTVEEKRAAMKAEEKIRSVRKEYSEGKLAPPPQKVPAKPKEEVWILRWTATDELMNENHQQKPFSEYVASNVTHSEKELSFVCFKGKRQEDKIVLTREDEKQAYVGYLFNKIKKEYTPIWLLPENDGYKGYIFANNGPKIIATLKKRNQ